MLDPQSFELGSIDLSLEFTPVTPDVFANALGELKVNQWRSPELKATDFVIELRKFLPQISLQSSRARIGVFDRKVQIIIGREGISIPTDDKKPFLVTEELLRPLESDLNFIMALLIGRLGLKSSDVKVTGTLSMKHAENDYEYANHLFKNSAQSLANWSKSANFTGLYFRTDEDLAGMQMKVHYEFDRREKDTTINSALEGQLTGSLPLVTLVATLKEHMIAAYTSIWKEKS